MIETLKNFGVGVLFIGALTTTLITIMSLGHLIVAYPAIAGPAVFTLVAWGLGKLWRSA